MRQGFLILLAGLALVACVKLDNKADDEALNPPVRKISDDFGDVVRGPQLDGVWASECREGLDRSGYQLTYLLQGPNIQITKKTFEDTNCTQPRNTVSFKGLMRFAEAYREGIYKVDYRFEIPGGFSSTAENVRLTTGILWVSEFYSGDAKIIPTTALHQQSGMPSPTPEPDPNLVKGEMARTWSEVKYAFCSNQGYASLIDFGGVDLSRVRSGRLSWGVRSCGSSSAFDWHSEIEFQLTGDERDYRLNFGSSSSIEDNGQGLTAAWSVLGGNSGLCWFLKNKGVRDVAYDCR